MYFSLFLRKLLLVDKNFLIQMIVLSYLISEFFEIFLSFINVSVSSAFSRNCVSIFSKINKTPIKFKINMTTPIIKNAVGTRFNKSILLFVEKYL